MNKQLKYCSFVLFVVISEKVVGDCFVSSHDAMGYSQCNVIYDVIQGPLGLKTIWKIILCEKEEKQVSKRSAN